MFGWEVGFVYQVTIGEGCVVGALSVILKVDTTILNCSKAPTKVVIVIIGRLING
jgi:acetyltransferase-like isoleucine patch superfamily enzyme